MNVRIPGHPTPAFLLTAALLALALVPLPGGWARSLRQSARALEQNRVDREATAGSYYEGLINIGGDGSRNELALRLMGKPADWVNFQQVGVTQYRLGDPLQFELLPGVSKTLFGEPFTTNRHGLRDREYEAVKPPGVFRIAILGASIDMGWGVGTEQTYENCLEDWLNQHAELRGLPRRFEVLNFAVAAYSPLHRLEAFRRKARAFQPDLVIYSATLLDPRLLEIHLCGLLHDRVGCADAFVNQAVARAELTTADLARDAKGGLAHKDLVKARLRPQLWPVIDGTLGTLAAECRAANLPVLCVIVPRAGNSDGARDRAPDVARYAGFCAQHAIPLLDLTATFDDQDPASVEIAPWDDHPNARGHHLLFRALAGRIVDEPGLYRTIFHADPLHSELQTHEYVK